MLEHTSLEEQLEAVAVDRPRVLVVGAGAAGLTLAQLLRRQGLHPVLVEKAAPDAAAGYMLALMPLADPVLDALGAMDAYLSRSTPMRRYRIRGRHGQPLREYPMDRLLSEAGHYRGISRGALMDVLASPGGTVTHHTTVTAIEQTPTTAHVTLDARGRSYAGAFDLVVAADGLHSTTRQLLLAPTEVSTYDTGWGGWVGWAEPDAEPDLGWEIWGTGAFIGTYPVKDRVGVIVCGPRDATRHGPRPFVARARAGLDGVDARLERALHQVAYGDETYFWPLTDCRAARWTDGRVVLLGDAAAGFLPTAGIGACMAMESAGVLGAHLAGATPDEVPRRLRGYERAQRPRVEAAQSNSRGLAKLMFRDSRAYSVARDLAFRRAPLEAAIRPIRRLLRTRPSITPGVRQGDRTPG
ncbi:FAD-dependent oxidoreductase [Streptomyces youssoufiensis]